MKTLNLKSFRGKYFPAIRYKICVHNAVLFLITTYTVERNFNDDSVDVRFLALFNNYQEWEGEARATYRRYLVIYIRKEM